MRHRSRVFCSLNSHARKTFAMRRNTCVATFGFAALMVPLMAHLAHFPRRNTESKSESRKALAGQNLPLTNHERRNQTTKPLFNLRAPRFPPRPSNAAHSELKVPEFCQKWRQLALDAKNIRPYREHFTSHDLTDWLVYTSFFHEDWHATQRSRPVYVDIAANHAKKWSSTFFLDRCMGWNGICVEANDKYWEELTTERHCSVVKACVSDKEGRTVNFSLTDAYGGVVASKEERWGVNGSSHATNGKFQSQFNGFKTMTCRTMKDVLRKEGQIEGADHRGIAFMSLDVEGHEFSVLKGFDWNVPIDVIITENRTKPVRDLLNDRGFRRLKAFTDEVWVRKGTAYDIPDKVKEMIAIFDRESYTFKLPNVGAKPM